VWNEIALRKTILIQVKSFYSIRLILISSENVKKKLCSGEVHTIAALYRYQRIFREAKNLQGPELSEEYLAKVYTMATYFD
jgi:hypothetical protein